LLLFNQAIQGGSILRAAKEYIGILKQLNTKIFVFCKELNNLALTHEAICNAPKGNQQNGARFHQ